MASLSEVYIKKETLETIIKVLNKKTGDDAKGIKVTINLSDEPNQWGQNVSLLVSQTKEQRDAKVKAFYIGNGKTFWTKGETSVPLKDKLKSMNDIPANTSFDEEELPF